MFLLCEISCGEISCGENKGKDNYKRFIFPVNGVELIKVYSKNRIEVIFGEESHFFKPCDIRIEPNFNEALEWLQ